MAGKFNLSDHLQPAGRDIGVITDEVLALKRAAGDSLLALGQRLIEAKAVLSHGEWLPWLEGQVGFSERAAQQYMKLARAYTNPQALADLGATKALMLLALPDGEREEFIEAPHVVADGEKSVKEMTTRELESALRERDEARRAAEQAAADQRAAEEARAKISADMVAASLRLEGLNGELEQSRTEARQAEERAEALERELAELKAKPVEVAVEADPAAIEAARKEAEAAMKAKLDKAKERQKKAEEKQKAAEENAARAREETEQLRAQLTAKAERDEKRAKIAADEDLALFQDILVNMQKEANQLSGVLMKVRAKSQETAGRLEQALLALSEKVKEAAAK